MLAGVDARRVGAELGRVAVDGEVGEVAEELLDAADLRRWLHKRWLHNVVTQCGYTMWLRRGWRGSG